MGILRGCDQHTDTWFMNEALKQARRAFDAGEVPVGAIVVDKNGVVIARAYNQTIKRSSPLAHAETLAIIKATRKQKDWRLNTCTLYVTIEPCALCMQLILMSRIARVVYGASSPLYGFSLDKYCSFDLYKKPLAITSGVSAGLAQQYMKQFFKQKRKSLWCIKPSKKPN